MVRCMHMQKVDFLMTRVYVVFPFFFFFGKTNIFTRKAQKKTGPDKSVNFNKSYKLHFAQVMHLLQYMYVTGQGSDTFINDNCQATYLFHGLHY